MGLALAALSLPRCAEPPQARFIGEVVDAETGAALPARVYLQGPDGAWRFVQSAAREGYAVRYGRDARGVNETHTTLSAHPFFADLPPGRYALTIERGKEYVPMDQEVVVGSEGARVRLPLRRWSDLAARGWYSGDTHVHRAVEDLPNLLLAEDLNAAFPQLHWTMRSDEAPFSRGMGASSGCSLRRDDFAPRTVTVDETHAFYLGNSGYEIDDVNDRPHRLGSVLVLHQKAALEVSAPPVRPFAKQAHAEGALLDLEKHNWPWSMMLVPIAKVDLFALANNHLWRGGFAQGTFGEPPPAWMKIEAGTRGFSEWGWAEYGFKTYYALLDSGFRLRPTAGSASGVHPVPLGFARVYVHLPQGFSLDAWLEGLRAGRSFVTTGPSLLATFDGEDPGHVFAEEEGAARREVRVAGMAAYFEPLDAIEIVVNGEVVRRVEPANRAAASGAIESAFDERVGIEGSSWIAVRCWTRRPEGRVRYAHTGPVFVEVPGRPLRPRREEIGFLVASVERELTRNAGILDEGGLAEYREALEIYEDIARTAR